MTATTPATAAATTGQQHNFSSGQTQVEHAPSSDGAPIQGDCAGGDVGVIRSATTRGIPTGSSSRQTEGASRPLPDVDDPRRSRQSTAPSGVRDCTTLTPPSSRERRWCGGHRNDTPRLASRRFEGVAVEPTGKCSIGTVTGPRRRVGCSSRSAAQAEGRDRRTLEGT